VVKTGGRALNQYRLLLGHLCEIGLEISPSNANWARIYDRHMPKMAGFWMGGLMSIVCTQCDLGPLLAYQLDPNKSSWRY